MRIFLVLLCMLMQVWGYSQSKDVITFSVKYKPETKYSQVMDQTSIVTMKFSGSDELLEMLKGRGVENPTVIEKVSKVESEIETGKFTDGRNFPLTMKYIKSTNNDGKVDIPDGTIIYGRGSIENKMVLDSIVSDGLEAEMKTILLNAIQSTYSQIKFPEKKLKVGESFSSETPLSIPIASVTVDMIITTTYKLLSIANGMADFDVSQVYTVKSTVISSTIKGTGTSKGKMLYDISNNYFIKYQMDTEMALNLNLEGMELDLISKGATVQTMVISANNE